MKHVLSSIGLLLAIAATLGCDNPMKPDKDKPLKPKAAVVAEVSSVSPAAIHPGSTAPRRS